MPSLDLEKEANDIVAPLPQGPSNWSLVGLIGGVSTATVAVAFFLVWASGVWPPKPPEPPPPPCVTSNTPCVKGNTRTMVYHMPGCMSYNSISPGNIKWFLTREDAEKAGFRRARNC